MAEKRPSELLRETLQKSAEEVAHWPQWMRDAMSSASIFQFNPHNAKSSIGEDNERAQKSGH